MRISLFVSVLSATSLLVTTYAQTSSVLNSDADAFIEGVLSTFGSPGGISVAVVKKDSITGQWTRETKGYGNATLSGGKMSDKTLMSIGSNSKLFEALAIGLLVHNETISPRLDWRSKLADVLPGFGLEDPVAAKQTSIIDALAHRTGMPRHDFALKITDDIPTLIEKMKSQRPSAEFRDIWQYSNEMYSILSYLPTALLPSKIPYTRYVKEHIIDPLGMNYTTFSTVVANNTGLLADGLVSSEVNGTRGPALAIPYWLRSGEDGNGLSGPGGIITNGEDLATWMQFLLLSGVNPKTNQTVVPSSVFSDIKEGVSIEKGFYDIVGGFPEFSPIAYSAGQESGSYRGIAYLEHTGGVPGFQSVIIRCPNDNLGIAVVSNDDDLGEYLVQIVKFWLLEEALGFTKVDWISRIQAYAATLTSSTTPRPTNATFSGGHGNISSLAGTYINKGYGSVEFCYAPSLNFSSSTSPSCKTLLQKPEIKSILSETSANVPTLVAEWNSPFASHFVINHFNGLVFNFTGYLVLPKRDTTRSLYAEARAVGGIVEFEKNLGGFGITGFWGAGDGVPEPLGEDVKERAEVWFDKLN